MPGGKNKITQNSKGIEAWSRLKHAGGTSRRALLPSSPAGDAALTAASWQLRGDVKRRGLAAWLVFPTPFLFSRLTTPAAAS